MARYGRSNHWRWQPRDSRGRFGSTGGWGGSSGPDPFDEWWNRQDLTTKVLLTIALIAFVVILYVTGYMLVFILYAWILIFIIRAIIALIS